MSTWFKSRAASSEHEAAPPGSSPPGASARNRGADGAGPATPELRGVDPVAASQAVATQPLAAQLPIGRGIAAVAVPVQAARTATAPFAEGGAATAVPVVEGRVQVDAQQAVRWASRHAPADAQPEPQPLAASLETPAPLRLHEESWPQGQAVWIAMRADDDTLRAMLPQIVADLQRGLQDRGQQLHQVVCNGRLVWRDGAAAGAQEKFQPRRVM